MESRIYAVCFVRDGQYPGCVFTIAVDMDRETAEMIIARELDAYTGFDMAKVVEILANAEKVLEKVNSVEEIQELTNYVNDRIKKASDFKESMGLESIEEIAKKYKVTDEIGTIDKINLNDYDFIGYDLLCVQKSPIN